MESFVGNSGNENPKKYNQPKSRKPIILTVPTDILNLCANPPQTPRTTLSSELL